MNQNPSVAIIVLNWNGYSDTVECLRSVRKSSYGNYKIVLVDNGSAQSEGRLIQELFPVIHLIENETNEGFAKGNNIAITWAINNGFEYIVNLNNDCIVESNWLEALICSVVKHNADFASSRIMYFPEKELICSDNNIVLPDGTGMVANHLKIFDGDYSVRPLFSACGAASIYSAACLEDTKIFGNQFFDELYFAYLEDVDLGIRLNAHGHKGITVPGAVVYHKASKTAGHRSYFQLFHSEKNRMLNEALNYPLWFIPIGELYYLFKTATRRIYGSIYKNRSATKTEVSREEKKISPLRVLYASRKWVFKNRKEILKDRKERKSRTLINGTVCRQMCWNVFKVIENWGMHNR